jgi:hypothetical protein
MKTTNEANEDWTPVHLAARNGTLNQIPSCLFSADLLALAAELQIAVADGYVGQIIAKLPDLPDEDAARFAETIYREAPEDVQAGFETFPPKTKALFMAYLFAR